jgi:hypothetical protein
MGDEREEENILPQQLVSDEDAISLGIEAIGRAEFDGEIDSTRVGRLEGVIPSALIVNRKFWPLLSSQETS